MNWAELADRKWSCGQAAEEPGPSAPVDAGRRSEEEEEGEVVFPGADFLSVTDITQVALLPAAPLRGPEEASYVSLDMKI